MTFGINVKGGTGAGRKKQKQPKEWTHDCTAQFAVNLVRLTSYSCPDCGARRPT